MPWETTGPPPDARVVDGVVVCRISLERPLAPLPSDGSGAAVAGDGSARHGSTDPFASIYRDFATLHTVTGTRPPLAYAAQLLHLKSISKPPILLFPSAFLVAWSPSRTV